MAYRGIFETIYRKNLWGGGSGSGSSEEYTRPYRTVLQKFLRTHEIKTVIDVGCGDWQFSQLIDWQGATYLGYDVVPFLIEQNQEKFARPGISFAVMPESYLDLPYADLVLCKDVLQHLSLAHAEELLAALERRGKHILVTNCVSPRDQLNTEIRDGYWRPLDIARAPFNRRARDIGRFDTKKISLLKGKPRSVKSGRMVEFE